MASPPALLHTTASVRRSRRHALGLLGAAGLGSAAAAPAPPWRPEPGVVRLARPHFLVPPRDWYPFQLLQAALAVGGEPLTLRPVDRMTDARALIELASPTAQVDVVVSMNALERQSPAHLVPAPVYAGLFGWRLLAVRQEDAARLAGLRSLAALRTLRWGQGEDWPDTEVLRFNGFQVATAKAIGPLYEALRAGQIDAFPRGVTEIWGELAAVGEGLTVLPGLALQYRRDLFFHVRPEWPALAQRIEAGLQRLRRDGTWGRLLHAHTAQALQRAALGQRRVIALQTPGLPPALQRIPADWWRPEALKAP